MNESIEILKKYQMKSATAFLLEKSGGLEQSLKLHMEIFLKYLMKAANAIEKEEPQEKCNLL